MRKWAAGLSVLCLMLAACEGEESPQPDGCNHSQVATGKTEKSLHPENPTSCKGVVLMCNYCKFNGEGELTGGGSEPCGACVGWDTN